MTKHEKNVKIKESAIHNTLFYIFVEEALLGNLKLFSLICSGSS